MSFGLVVQDLQNTLKSNMPQIRFMVRKDPARAYAKITEMGRTVGKKYEMDLIVNFPKEGRIEEFEMYGRRDLSLIIDMTKTNFPIERSLIKSRAEEVISGSRTEDAYMYEGKEGVKVFFDGGRIDVLPHSLHIWCEFTDEVTEFCDWLLASVYGRR